MFKLSHSSIRLKLSYKYEWPATLSGLERIILSAEGNLQRLLRSVASGCGNVYPHLACSAWFNSQITVEVIYSINKIYMAPNTKPVPLCMNDPASLSHALSIVSPECPIVQLRQVRLVCEGKTVCTAASTVRMKSPQSARLFLQAQLAIGQMFKELGSLPKFELSDVGFEDTYFSRAQHVQEHGSLLGREDDDQLNDNLWRNYRLSVPCFETDILEVFPSREMFK